MNITACPKCGSKEIFQGTMGDGVLTGYNTKDVCRDCGYQGQPLLFDSENAYNKFLEQLKGGEQHTEQTDVKNETPVDDTEDEFAELSPKDKEVVSLLKEYDKEKPGLTVWPKNKKWWPEMIIALGIATFTYFSGFSNLAAFMGIGIAVLYGALNFILNFVIYLLVIVIVEYFIYSIRDAVRTKH